MPPWQVARDYFDAEGRQPPSPCQLTLAYQAVRNVAAESALAADRQPVFALLYDERTTYFVGVSDWPGWVTVLPTRLSGSSVVFYPSPWPALLRAAPMPDAVIEWASDK